MDVQGGEKIIVNDKLFLLFTITTAIHLILKRYDSGSEKLFSYNLVTRYDMLMCFCLLKTKNIFG